MKKWDPAVWKNDFSQEYNTSTIKFCSLHIFILLRISLIPRMLLRFACVTQPATQEKMISINQLADAIVSILGQKKEDNKRRHSEEHFENLESF